MCRRVGFTFTFTFTFAFTFTFTFAFTFTFTFTFTFDITEARASFGTYPYPPIVWVGGAHGTIARARSGLRSGDLGFGGTPRERDRARELEILLSKKPLAFYEIGSSIGGDNSLSLATNSILNHFRLRAYLTHKK